MVPVASPVRFRADRPAWRASRCSETILASVGEDRRLHDLEVLLVLSSGAGCDLVEPFAGVDFVEAAETAEGGEELIVSADAGAGDKGAHGEGVDEGVVEMLIFEGVFGADIAFATDGLRRNTAGGADRLDEAMGFGSTQRRSAAASLIKVSA